MSKTITAAALILAFGLSACAGSSAGPAPEPAPEPIVADVPTQKY